jgi:hypothetical protein
MIQDQIYMYREFFNFVDRFTALRFTATAALLTARRIQILPITFGMKGSK